MSKTTEREVAAAQEKGHTEHAVGQMDVIEQLLKPEVQASLGVIMENLPKLAEMTTLLTRFYDTTQSIITDEVLMEDLKQGFGEFVTPLQQKAKSGAAMMIEANDRAQTNSNEIGLFGLLKMLKQPEIQHVFRFAQAYLEVVSERKNES